MTRQPWDPDPLFVAPEPVRRRKPDPELGCGIAMLGALVAMLAAALAVGMLIGVAIAAGLPAPRSDPLPSSQGTDAGRSGAPRADRIPVLGAPPAEIGSAVQAIRGLATWFDAPAGTAAAGPALRELLGPGWRGTTVRVCRKASCTSVRLTDWCACGDRHGEPTVIDLAVDSFARLAPLSKGVIEVVVSVGDVPPLPATDAAP